MSVGKSETTFSVKDVELLRVGEKYDKSWQGALKFRPGRESNLIFRKRKGELQCSSRDVCSDVVGHTRQRER